MPTTVSYSTPTPASAVDFTIEAYFAPATAADDTQLERIRIKCSGLVTGDNGHVREVTRYLRASASALPQDGPADGLSERTPAPITTLSGAQVTQLVQHLRDGAYAKWRALANND
jgi:hypothetical protein